ncbi:MAG: hypothetical protein JWO33_1592 [Caulobacteraceae bacterium]|nr:hypothetical protein [Caulobacteraceae bacterium]
MNEDRRQILQMLAEGKINADEAERLIAALEKGASPMNFASTPLPAAAKAKYLRVCVDTVEGDDGPTKVNIRVPMQLLRAGVRLSSLIPVEARDQVNAAMREQGIPFDVTQLKPENLEELIDTLNDLTVDVDQERTKVRIFAE